MATVSSIGHTLCRGTADIQAMLMFIGKTPNKQESVISRYLHIFLREVTLQVVPVLNIGRSLRQYTASKFAFKFSWVLNCVY